MRTSRSCAAHSAIASVRTTYASRIGALTVVPRGRCLYPELDVTRCAPAFGGGLRFCRTSAAERFASPGFVESAVCSQRRLKRRRTPTTSWTLRTTRTVSRGSRLVASRSHTTSRSATLPTATRNSTSLPPRDAAADLSRDQVSFPTCLATNSTALRTPFAVFADRTAG
jgi:hypothetical protein